MNKVILIGRLTKAPEVRYTTGAEPMAVARFTLAVDRRVARNNENGQTADFIPCIAWTKKAEFCEKYLDKGSKVAVTGRMQTGSYKDKDGRTVYTTDVVVEEIEFAGAKAESTEEKKPTPKPVDADGFMDVSSAIDEELPFV